MNWSQMLAEVLPVSLDLRNSLKKCCILLQCLENCRKKKRGCVCFILSVTQMHLFLENITVLQRGLFPLLFTFLSTQGVAKSRILKNGQQLGRFCCLPPLGRNWRSSCKFNNLNNRHWQFAVNKDQCGLVDNLSPDKPIYLQLTSLPYYLISGSTVLAPHTYFKHSYLFSLRSWFQSVTGHSPRFLLPQSRLLYANVWLACF